MAVKFLNVDLEVEAKEPLDYICAEFSTTDAHHLYNGESKRGYLANFECACGGSGCDPDSIINEFCDLIELFDEKAMKLWDSALSRTFDIGYEIDPKEKNRFHSELKVQTIKRISDIGASVVFTVYPEMS